MFINKIDYSMAIRLAAVEQMTGGDDTLVDAASDAAEAEMRSILKGFDVDVIFTATGEDRHKLLLRFCIDMAIYHLFALARPGVDATDRRARYERAVEWLIDVRDGKVASTLPSVEVPTDTGVHYTEGIKTQNYW